MQQDTLDLDGAVAPGVAQGRRVLALDLRGHGRSAMPRDASIPENLSLLARFIEREAKGSVTLVGNSMGGYLSMQLAAQRPELVESLVLVNPALPWTYARRVDPVVATVFGLYAVPGVGEFYLQRVLARVEPERAVGQMMKLCGAPPEQMDPAVLGAHVDLARERAATAPHRHRAFLSAARSLMRGLAVRGLFEHALHRVRAPTLLLHGDRDRLVPVTAARAVAARRRDWVYDEWRDTGHTPMLQSPDAFVRRLDRWCREGA